MGMYSKALFITLVVGLVLFFGGAAIYKSYLAPSVPEIGQLDLMEKQGVPDIKGATIDGVPFDMQQLSGKVILVNFWASWCGPCVQEFPSMFELVEKMKGKVILVAISQDDSLNEVKDFLKIFPDIPKENIFVLLDTNRDIGKKYAVDRLPESFIVGPNGKLAKKIIGSINWSDSEALKYFEAL